MVFPVRDANMGDRRRSPYRIQSARSSNHGPTSEVTETCSIAQPPLFIPHQALLRSGIRGNIGRKPAAHVTFLLGVALPRERRKEIADAEIADAEIAEKGAVGDEAGAENGG